MKAVQFDRPSSVAFLVGKNADRDAQDKEGNTGLHIAAGKGVHEGVELIQLITHRGVLDASDAAWRGFRAGCEEFLWPNTVTYCC